MIERIFEQTQDDEVDVKVEKIKYVIMAKEILEYFFNKRFIIFNRWEERKDRIDLDQFQYDYNKTLSTYTKVSHSGNIIHGTSEYREIDVNFGTKIGRIPIGKVPFFSIREDTTKKGETDVHVYMNNKINQVFECPISFKVQEKIIKIFNDNGYPISDINFFTL